jgi:hypothetical protein
MFALLGPILVIQRSLVGAYQSKDSLVASLLAQEGLEAVRAIRDHNAIFREVDDTYPWLSGLLTAVTPECNVVPGSKAGCIVDVLTPVAGLPKVSECSAACDPLRMSPAGTYGYNNLWPVSMFTRKITVSEDSHDKEALVNVLVTWNSHGLARQLSVDYTLFRW